MKFLKSFLFSILITILFHSASYASPNQYYEFENNLDDSMGNINMTMPSNTDNQPQFVDGPNNSVLSLDGNDYLVTANTNISFGQLTVTGFFNRTGSGYSTIFSMAYVGNTHSALPSENLDISITSNGAFRVHARANTNWQPDLLTDSGLIQNDQWYHFAYVYDMYAGSNGTGTLYINGELVTSLSYTYSQPTWNMSHDSRQYIGTYNEGTNGIDNFAGMFEGQIDSIKVYHSALTGTEIATEFASYADYNYTAPVIPEPLTLSLLSISVFVIRNQFKK